MSELLVADTLSKSFGRLKAVNQLSFSVQEGEIFGIAGPNGSGKSTLFNLLTNVPFGADSGEVKFQGKRIGRLSAHAICRLGMVRTFQKESVFESLSVWENVKLGAYYGQGANPEQRSIEESLELVALDKDKEAVNLSVYEKKRLMIASALATNPKLLLLDEPASSLTQVEINELTGLIHTLRQKGITIMLIEHVLSLLLSVSERLLVLNYGEKVILDVPDKVVKDERVIEAYLGAAHHA